MAIETVEAILTVTHEELVPSPDEAYDEESFHATRILKCAWGDRHDFARELRGWIEGDWPNFVRHLPHRYPDVPAAFVRSIGLEGQAKSGAEGSDTERISYANGYAELAVGYNTKGQGEGGGAGDNPIVIVTEALEPAAEFVTLSGTALGFVAPPGELDSVPAEDNDVTVLARTIEWIYTIHQLTTLPTAFLSLVSHVNQYEVFSHSLNFTFNPEVLLYHGASPRRIITTEGVEAWEVTLRFTARRFGWNKWWKPGSGPDDEPQPVYTTQGQYKPYPQADFINQLVLP